jgi:hypothetical protein
VTEAIPALIRATVIVHMSTDDSIRGRLAGAHSDALLMDDTERLTDSKPVPLGSPVLDRRAVAWLQVLDQPGT